MSCNSEIHIGDIGTSFQITIENCTTIFSLASATISIVLTKPNGTELTKVGSLYTDGTDGKVQYTSVAGDLDMAGLWSIQAIITIGSNIWHSEIGKFKVKYNL